jgi:hypothetical protein
MTVEVQLTHGHVAIVDDEDADLTELKWSALVGSSGLVYAIRNERKKSFLMHRVVMSRVLDRPLLRNEWVDHIEACSEVADNRRSNLRLCSPSENKRNSRKLKQGHSNLKGAALHKSSGKWESRIKVTGRQTHLGYFDTAEEAHAAYVVAAIHYFGEFANDGQRPLRLADAPPALNQLPLFDMEIAS